MNKALLVGINKYPDPENHLNGCVNDITDMAAFLVDKCKFKMDEIRLLTDARATKANIIERLKWLVTGLKAGDRIVFHYSGHGAQMATRAKTGEVDKLDEVICPYDFDWTSEHAIRDKEFVKIFSEVPKKVEFIWISDSCHSGDLTKGIEAPGKEHHRNKHIHPPVDIAWRNKTAVQKKMKLNQLSKTAAELNVALISGCKSDQTSSDAVFGKRYNGALTYYLLQELNSAKGLTEPLTELVKKVVGDLHKAEYEQTPQLEGSKTIIKNPFLKV